MTLLRSKAIEVAAVNEAYISAIEPTQDLLLRKAFITQLTHDMNCNAFSPWTAEEFAHIAVFRNEAFLKDMACAMCLGRFDGVSFDFENDVDIDELLISE